MAVWDEPGYYFIDRQAIVPNPVLIQDKEIAMNWFCTDLCSLPPLESKNKDTANYREKYFISRTHASVNLIDVRKHKVHCLFKTRNSFQRSEKIKISAIDENQQGTGDA